MLCTGELLTAAANTVRPRFRGVIALPLTDTSRRKGVQELVLLDDYQAEISIDPSKLTRKDKHAQKTLRK